MPKMNTEMIIIALFIVNMTFCKQQQTEQPIAVIVNKIYENGLDKNSLSKIT